MSRILLAAGVLAATLALADAAHASFTATVKQRTLVITGNGASDGLVVRLGARRIAGVPARRVARVLVRAGAGNDRIRVTGRGPRVTVNGGRGDDTLVGGDVLIGGKGKDVADGNRGRDRIRLGAGDDRFLWQPGDGSDAFSGGRGLDSLTFEGSSAGELLRLGRDGRLTRDAAASRLTGIERVDLFAGSGGDTVTLDDQSSTAIRTVNADLGGADGATDRLTVTGSTGDDAIDVSDGAVTGLAAAVGVGGRELERDELAVGALAGNDRVTGATLTTPYTVDGGEGADALTGGPAADTLRGGDGDDRFTWRPGDGNDAVDGQGDADVMAFNGSPDTELVSAAASNGRVLVSRNDVETASLAAVERLELATLGGADDLTIGELASAGLTAVGAALGDDTTLDRAIVATGAGNDAVAASGDANGVTVAANGLAVSLVGAERLLVDAGDGADTLSSTGLKPDAVQLRAEGGAGDDTLTGGPAREVFVAGDGADRVDPGGGNDTAQLDDGDDRFAWQVGDGTDDLDGGAGRDTLAAEGSPSVNGSLDVLTLSAPANITRLAANGAGQRTDFVGVEDVSARAPEFLIVEELGNSDVVAIEAVLPLDLKGDIVSFRGAGGRDDVTIAAAPGRVRMQGVAGTRILDVVGATPDDLLEFSGGGGNDRVDARGLDAALIDLHFVGGDGDDLLIGGEGGDFISGSAGDDRMDGGGGADFMEGGLGDDELRGGDGDDILRGEGGDDSLFGQGGVDDLDGGPGNDVEID
jgi:Ca2+-binding RTX toxin-like protein